MRNWRLIVDSCWRLGFDSSNFATIPFPFERLLHATTGRFRCHPSSTLGPAKRLLAKLHFQRQDWLHDSRFRQSSMRYSQTFRSGRVVSGVSLLCHALRGGQNCCLFHFSSFTLISMTTSRWFSSTISLCNCITQWAIEVIGDSRHLLSRGSQ